MDLVLGLARAHHARSAIGTFPRYAIGVVVACVAVACGDDDGDESDASIGSGSTTACDYLHAGIHTCNEFRSSAGGGGAGCSEGGGTPRATCPAGALGRCTMMLSGNTYTSYVYPDSGLTAEQAAQACAGIGWEPLGDVDASGSQGSGGAPADPGDHGRITEVAGGSGHACALFEDGAVICWGSNESGQLGVGDTEGRASADEPLFAVDLGSGRRAAAITAGGNVSCALFDDGAVKCWGSSGYGVLGLGEAGDTLDRGDEPGEMGDALPTIDLGSGRRAVAVRTSGYHTCALLDDESLKCWGRDSSGSLGLGEHEDRGDEPGEMGDALPSIDLGLGRTATQFAVGSRNTCAALDNGTLKCWGYNTRGNLGLGDTEGRGDDPDEMGDALPAVALGDVGSPIAVDIGNSICALLDTGVIKCWGENERGSLGLGDTVPRGGLPDEVANLAPVDLGAGQSAIAISVASHACALLDGGSVKCWGANASGALGLGDEEPRGDGPGEMGDALPVVDLGTGRSAVSIHASPGRSCAQLDEGSFKCWGNGRGDEPNEMGDALPTLDL